MTFPILSNEFLLHRLAYSPAGRVRAVVDTDTYNEIDDQFAVVYALLSPERLAVEAIYAAPFTGDRASTPGEGMEKSHEEILRLLERLRVPPTGLVFPGSTDYLTGRPAPERSPAALDLIEKALASPEDDPLYVLAIGAITNVASAILIEPEIIRHIVVVWLGGNPTHSPKPEEYNMMQDTRASQLMFDSGLPLVHIPCLGVASHLLTTRCELDQAIHGRNAISDFLYDRFVSYTSDHFAWAKEIWDISTVAFMLNPDWLPSQLEPSPILTDDLKYRPAPSGRHMIRAPWYLYRNPIFKDLFTKLQAVKDD